MRYLVGARYACLRCLRRGVFAGCVRCAQHGDVLDLATERGRFQLAMRRATGRLGVRTHGVVDPRGLAALPVGRRLLWVGTRLAFAAGFAAMVAPGGVVVPATRADVAVVTRAIIAMLVGLAGATAFAVFVAVAVLAALGLAGVVAQSMAGVAVVLGGVARVTPRPLSVQVARAWLWMTVAAQRDVVRGALEVVAWLFVTRLRVDDAVTAQGPWLAGVVRSRDPHPITSAVETSGAVEVRDAWALAFDLETADGDAVGVDVGTGVVELADPRGPRPDDGAADDPGAVVFPPWADPEPERRSRARVARISRGARVLVRGGVWSEEVDPGGTRTGFRGAPTRRVLRGHPGAPIVVRVIPG